MLRLLIWIPLLFALTNCSSDNPTAPPCKYTSTPLQQLKLSTTPDTIGLPFEQQKLVDLMWTPTSESECFVQKNGSVKLYKVVSAESSGTPETFVALKPSPAQSMKNWNESEAEIQSSARNSGSGPLPQLLGLTHFKYYDVPQEKIIATEILVRAEGRPWHLWHEYAHHLIGVARVNSPTAKIDVRHKEDVEAALTLALNAKDDSALLQKEFQNFSDLQMDFIEKKYVDEIVIESTLIDLALQAKNILPFDATDVEDSRGVIETFWHRYNRYSQNAVDDLRWETAGMSDEVQSLVELHIRRLEQHRNNVQSLVR
jgi:hypothetical protein